MWIALLMDAHCAKPTNAHDYDDCCSHHLLDTAIPT